MLVITFLNLQKNTMSIFLLLKKQQVKSLKILLLKLNFKHIQNQKDRDLSLASDMTQ